MSNSNNGLSSLGDIPRILYKCYSLNDYQQDINASKLKALENQEMWMSTYDSLNDPFEIAAFYVDYSKGYPVEVCDKIAKAFEQCRKDVRIASLSSNDYSSMLMWAYYSNNHEGFCVEFDVKERNKLWKMQYLSQRYGFINAFIRYMNGEMSAEEKKEFEQIISALSKTKGEEWSNEKEYRIVLPAESVRQVSNAGGVVSFQSVGLHPRRIFIGMKCNKENRKRIEKIGLSLQCETIPVEPSETEYKMVVKVNG